ncbi:hypothetical protein WUBG_05585 [Wuchereria bancrofti]|uniref:CCDC66 domain-containing protein n=1 Tax=Wuchereria bancrofti TaxID=6293 RepID=J9ELY9_WUCBA|nr:hypothetical protein WUBG_05585 [Wuchereria bancrofti]
MVRTYTWNPSTQSNLTIIGNINSENDKTVTNSLPDTSVNLCSTQCLSNDAIYRPNYKNGQTINISTSVLKDTTQNDTASNSTEVSSACNNHIECPKHMLQSQTASLWQPYHQSFPVYYPIPLDFPTNLYYWRPHLLSSQITAPVMFEQTTNLRPVDLWQLRPIQIGCKVYYEPVTSSPTLYSSTTSIVPHSVTSANLVTIPNNAQLQNGNLSHLPSVAISSLPADNINEQNKLVHSEACGINHSMICGLGPFSNSGSRNPPWTLNAPQPKSEIRGTPSWHTPLLITREDFMLDRKTNESSAVSTFQNPQCQTSNQQLHDNLYQHSLSHKITPSIQHQCYQKLTTIDSTEQYKRDLQLQIEQNRRRKEEERQRELEIERKEMIKFEEYRRKAQQEIEEEERKEKEKILAAQRRAARMRALHEEIALKDRHEAKNRMGRNVSCSAEGTKTLVVRTSSRDESNHLEWWEKKKEHVNDNAKRSVHSPVIPTLRKKNETFADFSRNTPFEISTNNASVPSCVPLDRSNKLHSRLRRRCYHSSLTLGWDSSSDSIRLRQKSPHIRQQNESSSISLQ